MTAIKIRRARSADAEAFCRTYEDAGVYEGTLQLPFPALDRWLERIANQESNVVLVAEVDGAVVGNLGLHPESNRRRAHAARVGMSVRADWQERGVGSALLAAVTDLADQWMGLLRLELTVFADNQRAIGLYHKFGFVEEGRLRAYALRAGAYVDVLTMARLHPAQPQLRAATL